MLDEWEEFRESFPAEMMRRSLETCIPFESATSYLKRWIYTFVCKYLKEGKANVLEDIFDMTRPWAGKKTPEFGANPFHWAFRALRQPQGDAYKPRDPHHLTKVMVWKFGRQLQYARRHVVPVEHLIGFLYQSGTPDDVADKAKRPDVFEDWYRDRERDGVARRH